MALGDFPWPWQVRDYIATAGMPAWPDPHGFWLGGSEYPTGRGQPQEPQAGWCCSGCGRGYSPKVMQCYHCGPGQAKPAGPGCGRPSEGGMCGCDEAG